MPPLSLSCRSWRLAAMWLLAAAMLSACSMPRLAYDKADWLVLRQIDSYLDLTGVQKSRVEEALAAAHRRHRRFVLPRFADAFADAATRTQRGITRADVHDFVDIARALLAASLDEVLPPVSEALVALSPEQQAHLATRLAERNEEYAEKHWLDRPRAERLERRAERTVSRIEDWTGPLSPEQLALVRTHRNDMPDNGAHWLAHRQAQQQALMAHLRRGAPSAEVQAFLRDWWLLKENLPPDLARVRKQQTEGYVTLIARLAGTLDSVQRNHLAHRLEDLARDARELAVAT